MQTDTHPDADRVSLLTSPGRGALAVVGIAGPSACRIVAAFFRPRGSMSLAERADASICFGTWVHAVDRPGEDLVVVKRDANHLEIHCHGGLAAPEAVIESLVSQGAIRQSWMEWLAAIGMDPIAIEAREAMSRVAGSRAARVLTRQATGVLRDEIARLESLSASARASCLERLLVASRIGLRLTDPWRVVLAGPVNAGKSSLANALAGFGRSIVSPEPGTTRDLVTTRLVLGGFDMELCDTAGLRELEDSISNTERAGMERARAAANAADLVIRVVPADASVTLPPAMGPEDLVVVTKTDLAPAGFVPPPGSVLTSATRGFGITDLEEAIVARLMPEAVADPSLLDGPVPFTERQISWVQSLVV